MIPLLGILLAAHAPKPAHEPPPPKLPDDADPSCAGGCYMFRDGAGCAGGCRLAAVARERAAGRAPGIPAKTLRRRARLAARAKVGPS